MRLEWRKAMRLGGLILGLSPALALGVTSCFVNITNLTCCTESWWIQCERDGQISQCQQTRVSANSYNVNRTRDANPSEKGRVALVTTVSGPCTYEKTTCSASVGLCTAAGTVTEDCVSTTNTGGECTGS